MAEADQMAAKGQSLQRACEGGLARAVKHHVHAALARQVGHDAGEVLLHIINHMVCTQRFDQAQFIGGGTGGEHLASQGLGPLDKDLADPSCRRMDKHRHTRSDPCNVVQQEGCADTFQQASGGGFVSDVVAQMNHQVGRHVAPFGIGPDGRAG